MDLTLQMIHRYFPNLSRDLKEEFAAKGVVRGIPAGLLEAKRRGSRRPDLRHREIAVDLHRAVTEVTAFSPHILFLCNKFAP
jgi:hypothetical protein